MTNMNWIHFPYLIALGPGWDPSCYQDDRLGCIEELGPASSLAPQIPRPLKSRMCWRLALRTEDMAGFDQEVATLSKWDPQIDPNFSKSYHHLFKMNFWNTTSHHFTSFQVSSSQSGHLDRLGETLWVAAWISAERTADSQLLLRSQLRHRYLVYELMTGGDIYDRLMKSRKRQNPVPFHWPGSQFSKEKNSGMKRQQENDKQDHESCLLNWYWDCCISHLALQLFCSIGARLQAFALAFEPCVFTSAIRVVEPCLARSTEKRQSVDAMSPCAPLALRKSATGQIASTVRRGATGVRWFQKMGPGSLVQQQIARCKSVLLTTAVNAVGKAFLKSLEMSKALWKSPAQPLETSSSNWLCLTRIVFQQSGMRWQSTSPCSRRAWPLLTKSIAYSPHVIWFQAYPTKNSAQNQLQVHVRRKPKRWWWLSGFPANKDSIARLENMDTASCVVDTCPVYLAVRMLAAWNARKPLQKLKKNDLPKRERRMLR